MSNKLSNEQKYYNKFIKSVINETRIPDPEKYQVSDRFYEDLYYTAYYGKPCRRFQRIRGFAKNMALQIPDWFQKKNMGM